MSKTKEQHLQTVASILADHLVREESEITLEKNLYADLGADSLDTVEIIMAIEEEYDIQIDDAAAANFQTVLDIVDYMMLNAPVLSPGGAEVSE